jgi:peptidoglycan/LPS O-acetylase OafA/YrhL
LYVIHPLLADTWLGSGDVVEKYAKRPLLLLVVFALSHLSTHYYERWFIERGRVLADRLGKGGKRFGPVVPVIQPLTGEKDGA